MSCTSVRPIGLFHASLSCHLGIRQLSYNHYDYVWGMAIRDHGPHHSRPTFSSNRLQRTSQFCAIDGDTDANLDANSRRNENLVESGSILWQNNNNKMKHFQKCLLLDPAVPTSSPLLSPPTHSCYLTLPEGLLLEGERDRWGWGEWTGMERRPVRRPPLSGPSPSRSRDQPV